ncbi:MAG: class III signal peptide-containing protein [Candidatus Altiarchaeales archaeon]|nr:class III signal peptide-containing protein [Candidatus Altiarchaeales archaeon]MBD3416551.1 class III signal peptide-containing protein [Candidatus Altiarchaeales archaeon]
MNKPWKKRGQVSIEFMIVLGIVLTIFIILGYIVYRNYVKTSDLKVYIYGVRLANHIADNINTINAVGEGHSTSFSLPPSLYGNRGYSVSFYENSSTVYVVGTSFSRGGGAVTFSSPISTANINCLLGECNMGCNTSRVEQCIAVNRSLDIRLVKYQGGIYMTQENNVMQASSEGSISPFTGEGDVTVGSIPSFVEVGEDWNVMYVHHNRLDDTVSLVISLNITSGDAAEYNIYDMVGEVLEVQSNEADPQNPEFSLSRPLEGAWNNDLGGLGDVDGAVLKFRDGFHLCIESGSGTMTSSDWKVVSSDGSSMLLDKEEDVCLAYP